jgi:hypothetical protein
MRMPPSALAPHNSTHAHLVARPTVGRVAGHGLVSHVAAGGAHRVVDEEGALVTRCSGRTLCGQARCVLHAPAPQQRCCCLWLRLSLRPSPPAACLVGCLLLLQLWRGRRLPAVIRLVLLRPLVSRCLWRQRAPSHTVLDLMPRLLLLLPPPTCRPSLCLLLLCGRRPAWRRSCCRPNETGRGRAAAAATWNCSCSCSCRRRHGLPRLLHASGHSSCSRLKARRHIHIRGLRRRRLLACRWRRRLLLLLLPAC